MALPGLLVEYLVTGSMALLWFLPLVTGTCEPSFNFAIATFLAPMLYVLGMFIDFLAFLFVSRLPLGRDRSLKALVRWVVLQNSDIVEAPDNVFLQEHGRTTRGTIWLYLHDAPDLVNEIKARSSRDRVARGAIVNIMIMWVMTSMEGFPGLLFVKEMQWHHWSWAGISLFSIMAWGLLEGNSYGFELRAGEMVSKRKSAMKRLTKEDTLHP